MDRATKILTRGEDGFTDAEIIKSLATGRGNPEHICQVNREIYKHVKGNPEAVMLLVKSFRMAKRMSKKLRWYKNRT